MKKNAKLNYLAVKECIEKRIIDIETLSKEELDALIDFETENIINSSSEPNMEFLDLCYDAMRKFNDYREEISEDECRQIGEKVYIEYTEKAIMDKPRIKAVRLLKRMAVACVTMFAICFLSLSVMAIYLGDYSSAWKYVADNVSAIIGMNGSKDIGGITVIKGNYSKKYPSIEELLIEENLDILYPADLPEGVKIEKIFVTYFDDDFQVSVGFENNSHSITIESFFLGELDDFEGCTIYTVNNLDFYIIYIENFGYQATMRTAGCEYRISSKNYDDLIFIVENMKGITK